MEGSFARATRLLVLTPFKVERYCRDELARFERQPWLANRPWCELLPPGSRVRKNDGVPSAPSCSLAPRGNLYLAHQQKFLPNAPSWTAHD